MARRHTLGGDAPAPLQLHVQRQPSKPWGTLGTLYVNNEPDVFTLEDVVREGPKIAHETAIPAGRYRIVIDKSQRFGRMLPRLLNVPGFTGVRIHSGNTSHDSSGCLLVGLGYYEGGLTRSKDALDRLHPQIAAALARKEDVWISIE